MLNKKNLFPILALTAIGVAVALLLSVVNIITSSKIAETERLAILESLQTVMPDGNFGGDEIVSEELSEDTPKTVQAIYKEKSGKGHVVILKVQGYASIISITVGIDSDGKVTEAVITSEQESHGKAEMKKYPEKFSGLNAGDVASVDTVSGATVTSGAIRGAIIDAMYALGYATDAGNTDDDVVSLPKTDSEIKELAESYVGGAVIECELRDDAPKTLKKLYYHKPSGSYIAYNITSTQYVAVETEAFVVVDKNGVVTDVDMLQWVVGHGEYPPENYTDAFIGKDRYSAIEPSELVTQATGTSTNFATAVHDVILYTSKLGSALPSIVGIVILSLSAVSIAAYIIVYKTRRRRK